MGKNAEITVLTDTMRVQRIATAYFISVTDITKFKNPDAPASPSMQMEILTGEHSLKRLEGGRA